MSQGGKPQQGNSNTQQRKQNASCKGSTAHIWGTDVYVPTAAAATTSVRRSFQSLQISHHVKGKAARVEAEDNIVGIKWTSTGTIRHRCSVRDSSRSSLAVSPRDQQLPVSILMLCICTITPQAVSVSTSDFGLSNGAGPPHGLVRPVRKEMERQGLLTELDQQDYLQRFYGHIELLDRKRLSSLLANPGPKTEHLHSSNMRRKRGWEWADTKLVADLPYLKAISGSIDPTNYHQNGTVVRVLDEVQGSELIEVVQALLAQVCIQFKQQDATECSAGVQWADYGRGALGNTRGIESFGSLSQFPDYHSLGRGLYISVVILMPPFRTARAAISQSIGPSSLRSVAATTALDGSNAVVVESHKAISTKL
ncbi:predicted protein [Phaeodactylum tricornutum CCAP 1055/1]|uniref:Uncharacterized protein n=5 Tax=Phaeodactylum tricornutum TaxID=2850 RepID=B7G8Q7_PHATC|nr:predicted protein [Phaeodactylum tricornutum CCAP 1055/1]EEC45084.1 predicted protein [Phaeodactylum tricornutum CCAP 1055/1]|eukprot:XP_002183384.1 predicted protein [Phaeodactylum tricornutum CCAP 1055/1]